MGGCACRGHRIVSGVLPCSYCVLACKHMGLLLSPYSALVVRSLLGPRLALCGFLVFELGSSHLLSKHFIHGTSSKAQEFFMGILLHGQNGLDCWPELSSSLGEGRGELMF